MQQIKRCEKVNRKSHSEEKSATTSGKVMHAYCGNSTDAATSVKVSHLQKRQAEEDHKFRASQKK